MKHLLAMLLTGLLTTGSAVAEKLPGPSQAAPVQATSPTPTTHPSEAERGERAFKANCSRCHYAPDSLNPRVTGTVIRHMRVRANLSAADERAIMRYLNP